MTIPKILHHLYLTTPHKPKDFVSTYPGDVQYLKKQFTIYKDWTHKLWTNVPEKSTPQTYELMQNAEVEIRNLNSLSTEYTYLLNLVQEFDVTIAPGKYNLIDDAKYLIAEAEGGIIMDLNYNPINPIPDSYIDQYSLMYNIRSEENCLFAVAKHSSVMNQILHRTTDCEQGSYTEADRYRGKEYCPKDYGYLMNTAWLIYQQELNNNHVKYDEILLLGGRLNPWCNDYIYDKDLDISEASFDQEKQFPRCLKLHLIGEDGKSLGAVHSEQNEYHTEL